MGKKTITGTTRLRDVGLVVWRAQETRLANGTVFMTVLQSARVNGRTLTDAEMQQLRDQTGTQ